MGEVWAASHLSLGREVAIKLIYEGSPELAARLKREALACGRLEHPNIVRVYDFGETEGGDPFLVMELLVGETLADRLAREQRLPAVDAVAIALDVARALRAAHEAGIVHRDLKPANVFLGQGVEGEHVKVLDFGVSKILTSFDMSVTTDGALVGSPAYMSPEQARALPEIDPRADLWAIGILLFEMLTGTRPFMALTVVGVVTEILAGPIPTLAASLPGVDPRLDAAVRRCLTRDVDQRTPSAAALIDMLTPVLASLREGRSNRRRVPIQEPPTVVNAPLPPADASVIDDPTSTVPKPPRVDDEELTIARPAPTRSDEDDDRETAVMAGREVLAFRMRNRAQQQPSAAPAKPAAPPRVPPPVPPRVPPPAPSAARIPPPAPSVPAPSVPVAAPSAPAPAAPAPAAHAVLAMPAHEDGPTFVLPSRSAEVPDVTAATAVLPPPFGPPPPAPPPATAWDTADTLRRTPAAPELPAPGASRWALPPVWQAALRDNAQALWMMAIAGLVIALVVFAGLSLLR
ncbi:Serine/threonine protein kinase [Minicystis rosea]|nr:Serine/threonine protein kinase [Minicystis rosea]